MKREQNFAKKIQLFDVGHPSTLLLGKPPLRHQNRPFSATNRSCTDLRSSGSIPVGCLRTWDARTATVRQRTAPYGAYLFKSNVWQTFSNNYIQITHPDVRRSSQLLLVAEIGHCEVSMGAGPCPHSNPLLNTTRVHSICTTVHWGGDQSSSK